MTRSSRIDNHPGRQKGLACTLALALGLGGGCATTAAANPGSMDQTEYTSAAEQQAQQAQAARQAQRTADAARAGTQAMAATIYVANCNDSGPGSLRDTVANAASGDIIDMSTMACNQINLSSGALIVNQDDLTLVGKDRIVATFFDNPDTYIHGSNRAIHHYGTGTLTLKYIDLSDGYVDGSNGACINSAGNVMVDRSYVHDCIATRSGGDPTDVKGGAIYAAGEVTLSGSSDLPFASSMVYDNIASAADGDAYGGGIYAGGWVQIEAMSSVANNLAESSNGNTSGGGIYGEKWVDLTESSSSVRDNTVKIHAQLTMTKGAGIYTEMDSQIHGSVTDNVSTYQVSGTYYIGQGVGIYAEDGVYGFSGSSFRGNHGSFSSGGGIFTNGYLILNEATIGDNVSYGTGAIFAKGNVTIANSTISGNRSAWSANIKLGPAATQDILIKSSTISDNIVTGGSENGAALNLQHDATVSNSTITGNIEKNDTDTRYGAGIALDSNVNVDLKSTIAGGNFIEEISGGMIASDIDEAQGASGATITGDHNLITLSGVFPIPPDTISLQSPLLGPLSDNGGPTKTHEPCRNSPTFENGAADSGVVYDQRGVGFPRLMGGRVDIGAVEAPDYRDIIFRNGFEDGACGS